MRIAPFVLALGLTAAAASPGSAQLLGGGLGLGPLGPTLGGLTQPVEPLLGGGGAVSAASGPRVLADPLMVTPFVAGAVSADAGSLLDQRRLRQREIIRRNSRILEPGPGGAPVRRGEIVATDLSPEDLAAARAAGFSVIRTETAEGAGLAIVVLAPPKGRSLGQALAALRSLAPSASFDFNAIYEPAGGPLRPGGAAAPSRPFPAVPPGVVIGVVDGGAAAHPALQHARIEQRGFAGAIAATGHGTAVVSLLVGDAPGFEGAAKDAQVLVADVYGGSVANGSAEALANAIGWLLARHARVINVSLVGPENRLVEAAVRAARAQGVLVVAAVGNDGPAAPPAYPAAYDGVVAVTGVDAHDRALPEAGRARRLDFAAPGADMAAALPGGGYAAVRGTSFAAPLVSARLAAYADDAADRLAAEARPGHGAVGRGVVCGDCRNDPRALAREKRR
jgi:hypothetical protein